MGGAIIDLDTRNVDVAPGQTVVENYEVETPSTGVVAGAIEFAGSSPVDRYYLCISGRSQQSFNLQAPFEDGNMTSYELLDLPGGTEEAPVADYNMHASSCVCRTLLSFPGKCHGCYCHELAPPATCCGPCGFREGPIPSTARNASGCKGPPSRPWSTAASRR